MRSLRAADGVHARGVPSHRSRRPLVLVAGGLATLLAAGWAGLHIRPSPLPPPEVEPGPLPTTPLPDGLPAPVERFYRTVYGEQVPVIDSAVISGRGTMRVAGLTFPARFRFSHVTGQHYRHYIELTVFGLRAMAVDEWFVDGHGRLDLPVGTSEGPNIDQGANLALWAEAVWMPAVWLTDDRARWEPVDATSARLVVPFDDETETLAVRFDPDSGLLRELTSLRCKGEEDDRRTGWHNHAEDWDEVDGHPAPLRTTVTWADEDSPWADLVTESIVYNADLTTYVRAQGP